MTDNKIDATYDIGLLVFFLGMITLGVLYEIARMFACGCG